MKTINCADCNVVYEYEPAKGYPDKRKYCSNCSEKKKQSWEGRPENPEPTKAEPAGAETVPMNPEEKPKKSYELTDGNIRIGALTCALKWLPNVEGLSISAIFTVAKEFEEYIRNGKE